MNAIESLIPLTNRQKKRKFQQQAMKFAPELQTIIDRFIFALWTYPDHIKYKEIYSYFLELWDKTIESFKFSEAHTIAINSLFFKENYQPKI